ncbi:MAG: hypothetical protein NC543_05640 [bacterium]|nr:hypothetical protein [bacterium]MCM1374452.1 hypothetical protein [Muribaculum sp.]
MLLSSVIPEVWQNVIVALVLVGIVVVFLMGLHKKSVYMKQQKETGADKKKVMDAMQKQMGDQFSNYSYVVGHYTKKEGGGGSYTYYYYPYILAFSNTELIIFSFLMRDGELIIRNRIDIDWNETELNSTENSNGTKMHIYIAGEMMIIQVEKVIKSFGVEKSDTPLGIYQEQEVERFINLLPQLKSYAVKK